MLGRASNHQPAPIAANSPMETNQPPSPYLTPYDLQQIANDLFSRYQQERDLTDLEEATALYHECILLLPENDDQRGSYLFNLATMLKVRSTHQQKDQSGGNSSGGSHLDTAISIYRESIQYTPDDDPLYPTRLFGLYSSLRLRISSQNMIEDRDEAISTVYESVLLTPEDHHEKSSRLNSLGAALHQRFEETQVPFDLDEAIFHYRASLELAPSTGEHRMTVLRNLALALKLRYQLKWDVDNLHESILHLSESVSLTPDGHPQRWPCANNHALLLYLKYKHDGARETLDKCIASFRMAARACSEADRPSCYTNLATVLCSRYEDLPGERGSLEESISLCEEALCLTPVGHKDRALVINQLYVSLSSHSSTEQDQKNIDRIISLLREAIGAAPSSDSDHSSYLTNLALSLVKRYQVLKSVDDLDDAISLYELSISLTPDTHLQKPSRLSDMASALYTKYNTIDPSIEGLNQVINLYREAAQLTPDSHSEKIHYLNNTAETLVTRAAQLSNRTDLYEALQLWSLAVTINSAALLPRFDIAKHWAEIAALNGLHESALTAYSTAISLLLKITSVVFNADSRREQLMQRSINLPCDAARCAIVLGQYEKAIELLESGRSIFWKQLLELHHPLDDLRKDAPGIADELQKVGDELERGGLRPRRDHPSVNSELEAKADETENYYARLGERREQLITEARKIPGFERFLLPLTFKELALSAKPGHVVVLNGTKRGCDALIIRSPDLSIHRVPLPNVDVPRLRDIVQKLCKLTGTKFHGRSDPRAGRPRAPLIRDEIKFPQVLADIWNWVVNPVLQSLALKPVSNPDDLPRIWWCPTGPFAFLPLHAAGIYPGAESGGTTVAEFAVSSYTPTISTLLTPYLPVNHLKVVAIIVPKTEAGLLPLPATEKELQIISKHVPENSLSSLVGSKTSIDDVLSELATATVAHFACHGVQHFTNPLDSALLLYRDRLTVSKLMQNRIQNASLVFLDACFTAAGSQELPDEAIHLASAMLFAGFRGAIATLWSIYDLDGPTVTESVYSQLFGNSLASEFDGASAAKALHLAVSSLRGQGKHVDFIRWVPFIHVGL